MGAIGAGAEVWGNSDIQGLIREAVDLTLQHTHTFIFSLSPSASPSATTPPWLSKAKGTTRARLADTQGGQNRQGQSWAKAPHRVQPGRWGRQDVRQREGPGTKCLDRGRRI